MNPKQALNILDRAAAQARLNRLEHGDVLQAVSVLAAVVDPQPAGPVSQADGAA